MHRQLIATAALLGSLVVLAGCSSAVSGSGHAAGSTAAKTGSSPSNSASGSTPRSTAPGSFPTDIAALAAKIRTGNRSIKSAHVSFFEQAAGTSVVGTGAERLSNGTPLAVSLTETVSGMTLQFRLVDGQVFAKVPQSVYPATRPWLQISSTTSDARLQQLYASLHSILSSGTVDTTQLFVSVAKDVQLKGTEQLDGTTVGHYAINVDIASLPGSFPNRAALEQSGLASIPIELFVDTAGRTRRVTENFTVAGQNVHLQFDLTKIDEPVTIAAPPASQVEHK